MSEEAARRPDVVARLRAAAQHAALKRLAEEQPEKYRQYYTEEKTKRGV